MYSDPLVHFAATAGLLLVGSFEGAWRSPVLVHFAATAVAGLLFVGSLEGAGRFPVPVLCCMAVGFEAGESAAFLFSLAWRDWRGAPSS